jgi:hypothetical protein
MLILGVLQRLNISPTDTDDIQKISIYLDNILHKKSLLLHKHKMIYANLTTVKNTILLKKLY